MKAKPCPFCGSEGKLVEIPGSWGYYSPRVRFACSQCWCEGPSFETEEWKQGKGTYSVRDRAVKRALEAWNARPASSPSRSRSG